MIYFDKENLNPVDKPGGGSYNIAKQRAQPDWRLCSLSQTVENDRFALEGFGRSFSLAVLVFAYFENEADQTDQHQCELEHFRICNHLSASLLIPPLGPCGGLMGLYGTWRETNRQPRSAAPEAGKPASGSILSQRFT